MQQDTDSSQPVVDFVVATDGSGDFLTIQEAIDAAYGDATIVVKPGEYKEQIELADTASDQT